MTRLSLRDNRLKLEESGQNSNQFRDFDINVPKFNKDNPKDVNM